MNRVFFALLLLLTPPVLGAELEIINYGQLPNDLTGDPPWVYLQKIKRNFDVITAGGGVLNSNLTRAVLGISAPINVLWYGADRTGVTNASSAINLAIAAVPAAGGKAYFPAGTYLINSTIVFSADKDVTLEGESSVNSVSGSYGTVIKLAAGANCNMLQKEIGGRVNLKGIVFDGNRNNQTSSGLYGLLFKGDSSRIDRSTVEDVCVVHVNGTGIQNDARESRFYRIRTEDNNGDGTVTTASSDVEIEDILSGFNNGVGLYLKGANYTRVVRGDVYRNLIGCVLTNANNNEFWGIQIDANERDGLILASGPGNFCTGNEFFACKPIVANFPYTHDFSPLTPTSVPSGTYSNVKWIGDNTIANNFWGGRFYAYENTLTTKPKCLIEDVRPYCSLNGLQGLQMGLFGTQVTTNVSYFVTEAYSTNFTRYASFKVWRDFSDYFTDNTFLRQLSVNQVYISDQLRTLNGLQSNAYFSNAWYYAGDGPAFNYRARTDDSVWHLQYAASNAANASLTWVDGINLNSTNGYVGIGPLPTNGLAVTPLDVQGTAKASLLETRDGVLVNLYFAGDGNFHRRFDGFAYQIQAQNTYSNLVISVASSNAATTVATLIPSIIIRADGSICFPSISGTNNLSIGASDSGGAGFRAVRAPN